LIWNEQSFLDKAQELVRAAISEHANHKIAELDRSHGAESGKERQEEGELVDMWPSTCTRWLQYSSEMQETCGSWQTQRIEREEARHNGVPAKGKQAQEEDPGSTYRRSE